MLVKVVWPTGVWINGEKVPYWKETDADDLTALELEAKRMVVIVADAPAKRGRPRKEQE